MSEQTSRFSPEIDSEQIRRAKIEEEQRLAQEFSEAHLQNTEAGRLGAHQPAVPEFKPDIPGITRPHVEQQPVAPEAITSVDELNDIIGKMLEGKTEFNPSDATEALAKILPGTEN